MILSSKLHLLFILIVADVEIPQVMGFLFFSTVLYLWFCRTKIQRSVVFAKNYRLYSLKIILTINLRKILYPADRGEIRTWVSWLLCSNSVSNFTSFDFWGKCILHVTGLKESIPAYGTLGKCLRTVPGLDQTKLGSQWRSDKVSCYKVGGTTSGWQSQQRCIKVTTNTEKSTNSQIIKKRWRVMIAYVTKKKWGLNKAERNKKKKEKKYFSRRFRNHLAKRTSLHSLHPPTRFDAVTSTTYRRRITPLGRWQGGQGISVNKQVF